MVLDPATFDTLYAAQADRLYASCFRILRDEQQAQDAVQETWVRAFSRGVDAPIDNPAAWLTTVARNLALDQYRSRKHHAPLAEEADDDELTAPQLVEDDPHSDPAKAVPADDQEQLALALIDELRPEQGRLLQLHYVDGIAIPELATLVGKTANATTVALHRARAALRRRYVDHIFARAALPEACRARKSEIVAATSGGPQSADLAAHLDTCPHCKETIAELRSMSAPWAVAPLLFVPVSLKTTIAIALATQTAAAGSGAAGLASSISASVSSSAPVTRAAWIGSHTPPLAVLAGIGAIGIMAGALLFGVPDAVYRYALAATTDSERVQLQQIGPRGESVEVAISDKEAVWLPLGWAAVGRADAPDEPSFINWLAAHPEVPEDVATTIADDLVAPGFSFVAFDPEGTVDGVTPQVSVSWIDRPEGDLEPWLAEQAAALTNHYGLASPADVESWRTLLAVDAYQFTYLFSVDGLVLAGSQLIVPMPDGRAIRLTTSYRAGQIDPFRWVSADLPELIDPAG